MKYPTHRLIGQLPAIVLGALPVALVMTILTWPLRDCFEAATGIVGSGMPMDALVNPAAKARFMFGGQAREPLVLRTPPGGGLAAGPQHS